MLLALSELVAQNIPLVGAVVLVMVLFLVKSLLFASPPKALQRGKSFTVRLAKATVVSHNTRIFEFALPHQGQVLGLPIGKHVMLSANINGEDCMRSYTPISSDNERGVFRVMIKVYPQGKMTQHLAAMHIGDSIDVSGPIGTFQYLGKGAYTINPPRRQGAVRRLGMLAGGSGITPMLQIMEAINRDPQDTTAVSLIYANVTEEDILLKDRLDELVAQNPGVFKIWYTLDKPPEGWAQGKGFISEEMIREHLPPPADDTLVMMCGPPPMIQYACYPNLEKVGFAKSQLFKC